MNYRVYLASPLGKTSNTTVPLSGVDCRVRRSNIAAEGCAWRP
ncbi:MAG TPA: hypothetical protein VIH59_09405 [Candidatus Tectomicrobia bacterium]